MCFGMSMCAMATIGWCCGSPKSQDIALGSGFRPHVEFQNGHMSDNRKKNILDLPLRENQQCSKKGNAEPHKPYCDGGCDGDIVMCGPQITRKLRQQSKSFS